jgi:hypothetical protein
MERSLVGAVGGEHEDVLDEENVVESSPSNDEGGDSDVGGDGAMVGVS